MDAFVARAALTPEEIDGLVTIANTAIKSEAELEGVTPYKTGNLSQSHFANDAKDGVGELGAGNSVVDYALVVHETHPTKAGWFIDTINTHGRRIYGRVIKDALRKKGAR
jgi:hypothetical protein